MSWPVSSWFLRSHKVLSDWLFSNEARDARWWFSVHITRDTRDSRHYAGWLSQPGSQSLFPSPRCRGLHTAHVSINTFCTPPFPSQTQKNVITEKIPRTSAFHVVTDHFVAEKRNKWWISRKTFIFLFHTISTSRSWNNPFNMSIYTKMIVKPNSISKLFFPDPCIVQHTFLWLLFSRVKHEMFNFKSYIYLTEIIKDTLSDACIIKVINKCYHSWCFMQMLARAQSSNVKKRLYLWTEKSYLEQHFTPTIYVFVYTT